jgi:hypothetical protein
VVDQWCIRVFHTHELELNYGCLLETYIHIYYCRYHTTDKDVVASPLNSDVFALNSDVFAAESLAAEEICLLSQCSSSASDSEP